MTARVEVTVNGAARELPAGTTVAALVDELAGRRAGVAVAVNEAVLPRASWERTELRPADRVEVLTAVQGG
jgi:sulfur carrier protein